MTIVEEMISSATLAGRYRAEASISPRVRMGWLRMAAAHSARARVLADKVDASGLPDDNDFAVIENMNFGQGK